MAYVLLEDAINQFILFLSISGIIANVFVCLLVLNSRQLRTYVNGFLISLAASDILTSTTLFVYVSFDGKPKSDFERALIKYLICVTTASEIGNLCAVSFERYLAVVKPLRYKTSVKRYFVWIVTTVWAASLLASLLVFLRLTDIRHSDLKKLYFAFVLAFVAVPFLFMIALYIRIYVELRRQKRRVDILRRTQRQPVNLRRNREAKVVKIFSVVASLFAASWIPAIAQELVRDIQTFKLSGSDSSFAVQLFVLGSMASSLANPFIYSFAKQDFKLQIRKIARNMRNKLCNPFSSTEVSSVSVPSSSRRITRDRVNTKRSFTLNPLNKLKPTSN